MKTNTVLQVGGVVMTTSGKFNSDVPMHTPDPLCLLFLAFIKEMNGDAGVT